MSNTKSKLHAEIARLQNILERLEGLTTTDAAKETAYELHLSKHVEKFSDFLSDEVEMIDARSDV